MAQDLNIQWFPGHMARTRRQIQASLKLVDAVVEVIDARIPLSSRNPELPSLTGHKPRIVLLNKCDAADKSVTNRWIDYYKSQGVPALAVDCRSGVGLNAFVPAVKNLLADKIEKAKLKGMVNRTLRLMVVGIPNAGKSSFINRMAKTVKAKVEDRPGVTRGNQWFSISGGIELLDTPGVLWPKFENQKVAERLAFTGAIKDNILDIESLAMRFIETVDDDYRNMIVERYKLPDIADMPSYEVLQLIARRRGMLISGGEVDTERAAITLLDEFRAAKLGRISLESPERNDIDE